jgi:hypothetical protein
MSPESEEKTKRRPLNRKFLLRGLVICVFLLLLPFAGIQAWKQSLFFFYKSLWEQNHLGNYVVYYSYGVDSIAHLEAYPYRADDIWDSAQRCLQHFACEITYQAETYLPVLIVYDSTDAYLPYMQTYGFFDCDREFEDIDYELQADCAQLFD